MNDRKPAYLPAYGEVAGVHVSQHGDSAGHTESPDATGNRTHPFRPRRNASLYHGAAVGWYAPGERGGAKLTHDVVSIALLGSSKCMGLTHNREFRLL